MSELSTAARIDRLLREGLTPQHLELRDDSPAHAGHASAGGKGHFRVRVVSTSFRGLKPLQRHRLVNDLLKSLFETDVHALTLEAFTPEEYGLINRRN